MKSFTGRVIKGVASRFKVATATGAVNCLARGKLKAGGDILVGDEVEVVRRPCSSPTNAILKEWILRSIIVWNGCGARRRRPAARTNS